MNELGNQFATGIVASLALEYLKQSGWFPWLSPASTNRLKVIAGALVAFLSTVGITYTFDYDPGNGGLITLALPSLHTVWDFAKQWALQEFVYRAQQKKA